MSVAELCEDENLNLAELSTYHPPTLCFAGVGISAWSPRI